MIRKLLLGALVAAAIPSMASAGTVNVATDFGSSLFRYGYGTATPLGLTFNPFTSSGTCVGAGGTSCVFGPTSSDYGFALPAIGVSTGGTASFYTNVVAPGVLFLQPGSAATGQDVILQFVAPAAGTYTFSGSLARIDSTTNGNGVNYGLFLNNVALAGGYLSNQGSPSFGGTLPLTLAKGAVVSLAVNNNGDFGYDGTGLSATITSSALPEPATWGLMILGFGAVGGLMRRRRVTTPTAPALA